MESYITLGFNIALLVFIFFGVFWGLIRGLRKTACRGIFLIIITIALLLLTPLITKALLGIKFNIVIELKNSTLSGSHNIKEILTFFIEEYLGGDFVSSHPEFTEFIISLPILLINAILYMLLFWICKYLLYPLNYLLYKLAFAPRKRKEVLGFSNIDDDNPFADFLNEDKKEDTNESPNQSPINENVQSTPQNININDDINNDTAIKATVSKPTESNVENNIETPAQQTDIPINNTNRVADENKIQPLSDKGMFIVKDPEYNKHQKLTEEIKEITEKSDKKEKKRLKKQAKKEFKKISKHRLLGGLVGGVCGLIVMLNTFIPIYGVLDILDNSKDVKIDNLTEEKLSLTSMTNGISDDIINGYNNSIFHFVSKYSGIKGLGLASFDSLTSTKHNDTKITLRDEIDSVVTTIEKADNLLGKYKEFAKDGNLSDLTKEEITVLLNDTKTLLNDVKEIKVVNALSDYIIPIAGNYLLTNEVEFTDNPIINQMVANLIVEMLESSGIDLFEEVSNLISVAEYLNEEDVLTTVLKNEFDDPIAIIKTLDDNFANELTTRLYKLKLVDVVLPHVMNISLTALDTSLDFGYEENSATSEQLKVSITDFLNKTIALAKTLDSSSDYYLTTNSLIPLGDFMDVVKTSHLINAETYNNLVSYAQNKLTHILNEIIPTELQKSINNEVLGNLTKVASWKQEMTLLNQAITLLRHKDDGFIGTAVKGQDLREGFSIDLELSDAVLANLGKAFDVLECSRLFGSANVRLLDLEGTGNKEYTLSTITYIMCDLLEYIKNSTISDAGYEELNDFIVKIENNLLQSKHIYNSEVKFWENEFKCISPLVIELSNTVKSEDFTISSTLGSKLDRAKSSVMFGNNACLTLINNALDIVKDGIVNENYVYNDGSNLSNPQTLDDKIYELFDGISTNLNKNQTKQDEKEISNFWTTEIDKYLSLIDIADKATTLSGIDDAVLLGEDLDNAFDSYTIPRLALSKTFAFAMKDVKYDNLEETDYINKQINRTIDNIAEKLENEDFVNAINEDNFWQIELEYISKVTNLDFNDNLIENLTTIGKTLDEVTYGYTKITLDNPNTPENEYLEENIRPSKLLTHEDLRLLLSSAVKECKPTLTSDFTGSTKTAVEKALTTIESNLADTNIPNISFEFELGKLKALSELDVNPNYFKKVEDPTTQAANRAGILNLGESLDLIAFNIKSGIASSGSDYIEVYVYNEELNSKIITRSVINTIIYDVIDNAEITSTETLTTNELAYNNIIGSIKTEIQTKSEGDYVFSWQRELGFINRLTQLDFEEELSFGNIASNVGSVLDGIAFNQAFYYDESYNTIYLKAFGDIEFTTLTNGTTEFKAITYLPGEIFYNKESDTTYGNSLFVTRTALLTAVESMISTLKKVDPDNDYDYNKEDIINELLDNATSKIAKTNTQYADSNYYQNVSSSFGDLSTINGNLDENDTENYIVIPTTLLDLSINTASNIDNKLAEIQTKQISGIITTRKIAIYILESINISAFPENSEIRILWSNTIQHYKDNLSNDTYMEYYYTTETIDASYYPNPFVTLQSKLPTT